MIPKQSTNLLVMALQYLSFQADRSGQTMQTQERLFLKEQSQIRVFTVCNSVAFLCGKTCLYRF